MGVYIMLGGMVLFASLVSLWDLLAERHERRARKTRSKP